MEPGHVVAMKGGPHAESGWDEIVAWKIADLRAAGVTFWGYNGTLCHPVRQVQPFAAAAGGEVAVAMVPTGSDPGIPAWWAREWSVDGVGWSPLPDGVRVSGSKHALVLDRLEPCDDMIDLAAYRVAVGPMTGRPANDYLRHRVDKGCFSRSMDTGTAARLMRVVLRGRLARPWAVFLR
jgi:hypothetical protein